MPYFDDLKTYRERAGLRKSELADKTGLDRGTIHRAEKHYNCMYESLAKIVNTLNEVHYTENGKALDVNLAITETSRFGKGLPSGKT